MSLRHAALFLLAAAVIGVGLAMAHLGRNPDKTAIVLPVPDTFRLLGAWPLGGDETIRLIHVPDSPTGLRCLIYQNPEQTVVQCDDDLPR